MLLSIFPLKSSIHLSSIFKKAVLDKYLYTQLVIAEFIGMLKREVGPMTYHFYSVYFSESLSIILI